MATHREDLSELSIMALAEVTGRSREYIRKRLVGLDPVREDGRTKWYAAPQALDRIFGGTGLNPQQEKARLDRTRNELAELQLEQQRGELLPRGDVEASVNAMVSAVRTRLLGVPTKAGPLAYAAETGQQAVEIIRDHVVEALEELAPAVARESRGGAGVPELPRGDRAGARDAAPAAAADGERVG